MPIKVKNGSPIYWVQRENISPESQELYTQKEYEKIEGMLAYFLETIPDNDGYNDLHFNITDEMREWYESYKNRKEKE